MFLGKLKFSKLQVVSNFYYFFMNIRKHRVFLIKKKNANGKHLKIILKALLIKKNRRRFYETIKDDSDNKIDFRLILLLLIDLPKQYLIL